MYVSKSYRYNLDTILLSSNRNIDFVLIIDLIHFEPLSNHIHIFFFQYSYCWMLQKRKMQVNQRPHLIKIECRYKKKLMEKKVWITHRSFTWFIFNEIFFLTKSNNIYTLCRVINHSANIFLVIFLSPYWSSLFSLFMFFRC